MTEESMARLGFVLWLTDLGYSPQDAARVALGKDPDVFGMLCRAASGNSEDPE